MIAYSKEAPVLRFDTVAAGYRNSAAFRGLSFSLREGEAACILGRNGCGKSTVLRSVFGLADVLSGSIEVDGTDVKSISRNQFVHLGVAYVPQRRGDFQSLTVEENIRLAVRCSSSKNSASIVHRIFDELPLLRQLQARKNGQLSGGEQTLVALGRALALRPRLRMLLVDEISAGLSAANVKLIVALFQCLREEGTVILAAEQSLPFAQMLSFSFLEPRWEIAVCSADQKVY